MEKKIIYIILSVIINILMCIGGAWTLLIGMFCMYGAFFSEFNLHDCIFGLIFYAGTYLAVILVNFVLYKIFKNRFELKLKYVITPIICVCLCGMIYTVLLLF